MSGYHGSVDHDSECDEYGGGGDIGDCDCEGDDGGDGLRDGVYVDDDDDAGGDGGGDEVGGGDGDGDHDDSVACGDGGGGDHYVDYGGDNSDVGVDY